MIAAPASAKKTDPTHWVIPNGSPTSYTQIHRMRFSEGAGASTRQLGTIPPVN